MGFQQLCEFATQGLQPVVTHHVLLLPEPGDLGTKFNFILEGRDLVRQPAASKPLILNDIMLHFTSNSFC